MKDKLGLVATLVLGISWLFCLMIFLISFMLVAFNYNLTIPGKLASTAFVIGSAFVAGGSLVEFIYKKKGAE